MNSFDKIYDVVRRIPRGKVASYGQVAELAGNPRWQRVVGYALHVNPDPEHIPCYRVVTKDGRLSPAFAFGGENVQRRLLEEDGVGFDAEGKVIMEKYRMRTLAPINTDAVFIDFYGTLVFEDGELINEITAGISASGDGTDPGEIGLYWWDKFRELFTGSYGSDFRTQRELEYISLERTVKRFHSSADAAALSEKLFAYWKRPDIFGDSKPFLELCPVPVYVVSNIDSADIAEAIRFHGIKTAGVVTSEDARSYKPRREIFDRAVNISEADRSRILHIGDSISSDVEGAASAGIRAVWLNRGGRSVPPGVVSVKKLTDIIDGGIL